MDMVYNYKLFMVMKNKNLKQYALANKAGIENSRFSRIMSGEKQPTPEEKKRISKALNKPQKSLFPKNTEEKK